MKTFLAVLKNDYLRMVPRMAMVVVMTTVTLASMMLAVYITDTQQVKAHIALIPQSQTAALPQDSKYLEIMVLPKKPPYSALAEQKYDAFVTVSGNGAMHIETLRNQAFKNMLQTLLQNPNARINDGHAERGVGVNLIGFMMMFLLMIAFSNLFAFANDKEQGQLRRIASTPASFGGYLAGHCVYALSLLLPEYLLLVVLKACGLNIGFSLAQFAGLMALLGFLGIAFALLLNIFIQKPDNASMLGNAVTVLTSILAGSFYSFSRDNPVLNDMVKVLPQKQLLDFAQQLQNGSTAGHAGSVAYVAGLSLAMFISAIIILKRMYVKKI